MAITQESRANYQRGILGDRFFGICNRGNGDIHLAMGGRGDGAVIPQARYSNIGGQRRNPIPAAGGHAILANWAGVPAVQQGQGVATGNAYGFMFEITPQGLRVAFRSGFNGQFQGARPGPTRAIDQTRTLPTILVNSVTQELGGLGVTIIPNFGDV